MTQTWSASSSSTLERDEEIILHPSIFSDNEAIKDIETPKYKVNLALHEKRYKFSDSFSSDNSGIKSIVFCSEKQSI